MSWWNYRVIERQCESDTEFRIHEVYYYDDGRINLWSADSVPALGNDMTELASDLNMMLAALTKPVLVEVDEKLVEKLL